MSTHVRRKCPYCKYVIKDWHINNEYWRTHIGVAVEKCPSCGKYVRCGNNVEVIMIKDQTAFIAKYLIVDLIKSVLYGVILGCLLSVFVCDGNHKGIFSLVGIIVLFVLHYLALKQDIKDSNERTKNIEYCQILRKLNLISEISATNFNTNNTAENSYSKKSVAINNDKQNEENVPQILYCRKCGNKLLEDEDFCSYCGTKID